MPSAHGTDSRCKGMSVNRKHVVWQSKNGLWNIGFWDYYNINEDDEDFDYEWDVEYYDDEFNWVSRGHATSDKAEDSWDGANPGGADDIVEYSDQTAAECEKLDALAEKFLGSRRR